LSIFKDQSKKFKEEIWITLFELWTLLFALCSLKIRVHRKFKLIHKNLFERLDIRLLIKDEHRLLVFERIDSPERNRTIVIIQKNRVADDTSRALIPI
jgi:hypothetical protein